MTAKAVLYAAKSTEDKHGSIPDQLADCRKLAGDAYELVAEFSDEAKSAYSGNRGPNLARAMTECERLSAEHGSCALIIQHSDRLARGDGKAARHLAEYALWALKHDVRLLSVQDPDMLAQGDYGLLMSTVGGIRNNEDSKRKSASVKDGMRRRAVERGQPNGGPAGFGFHYEIYVEDDEPRRRRISFEPQAAVVRRIFGEFVAGRSQWQITRDLNMDGIGSQRGGKWYQGTVSKLLRCPLYVGQFVFNGETFAGDIPAIIDPETWARAQAILIRNAAPTGKVDKKGRPITSGRGRAPAGRHLFVKGMLRCGLCGEAMIPVTQPTRTPGRLYEIYQCQGRRVHGPDSCSRTPVRRELIDGAVWDYFAKVALDVDATKAAIFGHANAKVVELDALRDQAGRDAAKAHDRLVRVKSDYMDGSLGAADWKEFSEELTADLEAANAQVERLDAQRAALAADVHQIDAEGTLLHELAAIRAQVAGDAQEGARGGTDALRATLRRLFDRFELVPSDRFDYLLAASQSADGIPSRKAPVVDGGLLLVPYVRPEAIDLTPEDSEWPAIRRVSLDLRDLQVNPLGR